MVAMGLFFLVERSKEGGRGAIVMVLACRGR